MVPLHLYKWTADPVYSAGVREPMQLHKIWKTKYFIYLYSITKRLMGPSTTDSLGRID